MNALPAHLQGRQSRNLAQRAIDNIGAGNPPHLSIAGGRFTLVDVAGNTIPVQTFHIDVVIVDVNEHISKIFFGKDKPYDPNSPSPPLCFSDNGVAPSTQAGQPQSATCASCEHNVWGSKISQMGSAVKQCADQQKVAIYAPEYSDGMFLLRIPPGSFANWRAYMAKFAAAKIDPDWVITRISFEPGAVGTLVFQSPGYINEQQAAVVAQMIDARAADQLVGRLDRPRSAALAAPMQTVPNESNLAWSPQNPMPVPQMHIPPAPSAAPQTVTPFPPQQTPPTPAPGPVPGAPTQQPAPGTPPRRRRTKAEMQAAQAPAGAPQQAPFMATPATPATQGQPAPFAPTATTSATQADFATASPSSPAPFQPDPPPQQQFGIAQNPPPPPAGLDLDAVFK